MTYDRKFKLSEGIFYLRIFGTATEGDVGTHRAVIKLLTPVLGKHYYPHGVEYGKDEVFPQYLVKRCEHILKELKEEITRTIPGKQAQN